MLFLGIIQFFLKYIRSYDDFDFVSTLYLKGRCKVYFIAWSVQNANGVIIFIEPTRGGSTLFLKQISTGQ